MSSHLLLAVGLLLAADESTQRDAGTRADAGDVLAPFRSGTCDKYGYASRGWEAWKLPTPCTVILAAIKNGSDAATVARELARAYSLPLSAAEDWLTAEAAFERAHDFERQDERDQRALAEASLRAALKDAPGHRAVVGRILAAANTGEVDVGLLREALETSQEPGALARSLLFDEQGSSEALTFLATYALAKDPASLDEIVAGWGIGTGRHGWGLYLRMLELALSRPHRPQYLPRLVSVVLAEALDARLDSLAIELYRALPEDVRLAWIQSLARGDGGESDADPRLTLAVALLGAGDLASARVLAGPARPRPTQADAGTPDALRPGEGCGEALRLRVLEARLDPASPVDAYALAEAAQLCGEPVDAYALAAALERKYPTVARELLQDADRVLTSLSSDLDRGGAAGLQDPLRGSLAQAYDAERARVRKALSAMAPADAGQPIADPAAAYIASALAADVAPVWSEHPLPKGIAPAKKARARASEEDPHLPRGFWPVRVEKSGRECWAVALSQNADPAGEVSAGGYWLFHAAKGCRAWEPPLYMGLRHLQPYDIVSSSGLPMLKDGKIQLETHIRELDPKSITFPPVGLAAKRTASGLYLEASLDALRADSDGDLLTDLLELRLATDPKSKDTDGDGFDDGEDPFPNVPLPKAEPPATADLLTAFFVELFRGGQPEGLVVGLPDSGKADPLRLPEGRAPVGRDPIVFIEGDRREYVGARSPMRTLIFSPGEVEAIRKRAGVFYPLHLQITVDAEGGRGLIIWDEGWRGGTYKATREQGRWILSDAGSWIT